MSWLKTRLARNGAPLTLIGAYDALSAKLTLIGGAEAVYCGGFSTTAARHALPDLGLLGLRDMVEIYEPIVRAAEGAPVIVDADSGHGGLLNVQRTAKMFADIGIAAFHLEDQVTPKRCGHLSGKDVVDREEAIARIKAAYDVCGSDGPAIIARSDAIAVHGYHEAIQRANLFLDAGATAVFIDAPQDLSQIANIPRDVEGPVVFNAARTGVGPDMDFDQISAFGYSVVLYPGETLFAAVEAVQSATAALLGRDEPIPACTFQRANQLLETDVFLDRERSIARVDWGGED